MVMWVLTKLHLSRSYLSHCGCFFILLLVSLQVILVDKSSVNSYNFLVPMGGVELSAFLFGHFCHRYVAKFFKQ